MKKFLISVCLFTGCISSPDKPYSIDGKYQSDFIESAPLDSNIILTRISSRKDMLVIEGDSLKYFVCSYSVGTANGIESTDTLREVQLTGGRYRIAGDSMYFEGVYYGRTGELPNGPLIVDTIHFEIEKNDYRFKTPVKTAQGMLELEFDLESRKLFVPFRKTDRLSF